MILWLLACVGQAIFEPVDPDPLHDGQPVISSVDWECDAEDAKWTVTVDTEQWSGGGYLWMAKDELNAEAHRMPSVKAAADGTTDRLQVKLSVKADWRDAKSGSSTRWLCAETPQLSFLVTAYDTSGDEVHDCRTWGADPSLWTRIDNAHDCDTLLEGSVPPEDAGDTGDDTGS